MTDLNGVELRVGDRVMCCGTVAAVDRMMPLVDFEGNQVYVACWRVEAQFDGRTGASQRERNVGGKAEPTCDRCGHKMVEYNGVWACINTRHTVQSQTFKRTDKRPDAGWTGGPATKAE